MYASWYPPKKAKGLCRKELLVCADKITSSKLEEINTQRKGNFITDACGKRGRKKIKRMDQV